MTTDATTVGGDRDRPRTTPHGADPAPGTDRSVGGRRAGRGRHQLRDLDRRGRMVAVLCGLLLLVPVGASVGRALAEGWLPSNDDALIVLQARDTFTTDPPLVGQPSTSARYTDGLRVRHPGAIEFHLLALPVRVLGPALGTLLTVGAVVGGSVLLTAWIAFRRAGPAAGLTAAVLLTGAMWSSGTAVLTDPLSSNAGGYPLVAGTALAWAVWCDDRRLWPLAVVVWSYTIQQHLAIFAIAGIVAAWGVAGAVVTTFRHRREVGRLLSSARWAAAAVAVGVVCWLAPLADQVVGQGNLGRIAELSSHSDRPTLGLASGLRAAGRALAVPPVLVTRRLADGRLAGFTVIEPFSGWDAIGATLGVGAFAAAVVVAIVRRRRDVDGDARLALAATVVVVALGGVLTASNVPDSYEAARINFSRWVWSAAVAAWAVVVWSAWGLISAARRDRPVPGGRSRAPAAIGAALLLVAAWGAATATRDGFGDQRLDEPVFAFEAEAVDQLQADLPRDRPVRVRSVGGGATISVAPALVLGLEEHGFDVRVDEGSRAGYGGGRARPPEDEETLVLVRSSAGPLPPADGTVVATVELPVEPGGEDELWGNDHFEVRVVA